MYDLYAHPGSFSGWAVQILFKELGQEYSLHDVDLYDAAQLKMEFLRISSRGTVPVLIVDSATKLIGVSQIINFLKQNFSTHTIFQGETEAYLKKLDEISVGFLTFGLAFHQENTKVLRYPFNNSDFFDKSRKYILERGKAIQDVISTCEDAEIATSLIEVAEQHYTNVEQYMNPDMYSSGLTSVSSLLDWFEGDLGADGRTGLWLGGALCNVADLLLGLLLHRCWQLGLDSTFFTEGVRPHLTLYYRRIRDRSSFRSITLWDKNSSELVIKSEEDKFADNAKIGIGILAALGGLFIGKKILKK